MSLSVYVPYFLDREKENFKVAKGNYKIDYRGKGDTSIDSSFTCNTIPYKELKDLDSFDLSLIPAEIEDVPHVTGEDKNFRGFTIDLIVEADKGTEFSQLYLLPEESFKVTFNSVELVEDDEGKKFAEVTFIVNKYQGKNGEKTLFSLYSGGADCWPLSEKIVSTLGKGILQDSTTPFISNTMVNRLFNGTQEYIKFKEDQYYTPLKEVSTLTFRMIEVVELGAEEEAIGFYSEMFEAVENVFIFEKDSTVLTSLLPLAELTSTVNKLKSLKNVSKNPFTNTSITNYRDFINLEKDNLALLLNTIGLYTPLPSKASYLICMSIYSTVAKDLNFDPRNTTIPKYRLYTTKDLTASFNPPQAVKITNKDCNVFVSKGLETKKLEYNINKTYKNFESFASEGLVVHDLGDSIAVEAIEKEDTSLSFVDFTAEDFYPLSSSETSKLDVSIPFQLLDYITSEREVQGFEVVNAFVRASYRLKKYKGGLFTPIIKDKMTKDLNLTINSKQVFVGSWQDLTPDISSNNVDTLASRVRANLKKVQSTLKELNVDIKTTPKGLLSLRNLDRSFKVIGVTADYVTSNGNLLDKSYKYAPEAVGDNTYVTMLVADETVERYNPLLELEGEPFILKVLNLTAENKHSLKIVVSSDPDYGLLEAETILDSETKDINLLANTLNQRLREYGVLAAKYDANSLFFYGIGGRDTILDFYLYADVEEENAVQRAHKEIANPSEALTTESTSGVLNFTLPSSTNLSHSYWYNEDGKRQPMMIKEHTKIQPSSILLQFNPKSSDVVLRCKIETSNTTFNILNLNLPPLSIYETSKLDYYTMIKDSLEASLISLLGSGDNYVLEIVTDTFKTAYSGAVIDPVAIRITNTSKNIRQMKFAFSGDSKVFEVSTDDRYSINTEYKTHVEIFKEFQGVTLKNGISYWLRGEGL